MLKENNKMKFDDYVNGRIFPPPTKQDGEKIVTSIDRDKIFLSFLEQCEREKQMEEKINRESRRDLRIAYLLMVISTIAILILSILNLSDK